MPSELKSGYPAHFGYSPNPGHAEALAERVMPRYGAGLDALGIDDGGDRYNYRMLVACLEAAGIRKWLVQDGEYLRLNTYDQGQTSSCTGNARSIQLALELATQIVADGDPHDFPAMPAAEIQYALGLELEGSLGSDSGCSGSALVECAEVYGAGYQMLMAGEDCSTGNAAGEDLAAWQRRLLRYVRDGVPLALKPWLRGKRSEAHARIETTDQAWAALGHGYPIILCSNVSYDGARGAEGVIRRTGSAWPHAMCCSSRRTSAKYGRLFLVHNSWTPAWTSGPYWLDQPVGSFWIREDDLADMLVCQWSRRMTVRDCWISTGARGFVRRDTLLPRWATAA